MDLVNDCVSDIIDYNLQLTAARGSLSKATHALEQKKCYVKSGNSIGFEAGGQMMVLELFLSSFTN